MSFKKFFRSVDNASQSASNFVVTFSPPLQFKEDYEIALSGGSIVNTVSNLSAALGNNQLRYSPDGGATWRNVTLSDGSYQCTALNTELQITMDANGDYTVVNGERQYPITFLASLYLNRVQIVLKANTRLDISIGSFATLIGFNSQILNPGGAQATFTASTNAKFTDPSANYFIYCDAVSDGVDLGPSFRSGILKAVPGGDSGLAVNLKEVNGVYDYFPLKSRYVASIRFTVYDSLLRIADLRGESCSYEILFRRVGQSNSR